MDEEEKLNRITRMLERGCTMLAEHHDCGAPLFRCKGEILCPICSSAAKPSNGLGSNLSMDDDRLDSEGADKDKSIERCQLDDADIITSKAHETADNRGLQGDYQKALNHYNSELDNPAPKRFSKESNEAQDCSDIGIVKRSLKTAILLKIKDLESDIKSEKDYTRLKSQLDCVDALLRTINLLEE